jgi:hypothetical protein
VVWDLVVVLLLIGCGLGFCGLGFRCCVVVLLLLSGCGLGFCCCLGVDWGVDDVLLLSVIVVWVSKMCGLGVVWGGLVWGGLVWDCVMWFYCCLGVVWGCVVWFYCCLGVVRASPVVVLLLLNVIWGCVVRVWCGVLWSGVLLLFCCYLGVV